MSYNKGMAAATSSFVMWGLLPVYWKLLEDVPAYEILSHRMVWSLVVALSLLGVTGNLQGFLALFRQIRQLSYFLLTALILSMNWFIYIWSVNSGHIVEASLGYFINPLVSVCFGVIFLRERMRAMQWISVFLALLGVLYLTWVYGAVPWIALSLATTFACYGLLRKITTVPALEGLCLETSILFLPACGFLLYFETAGSGPFLQGSLSQTLLLAGTGIATTAPLLCFCYAAQKIPLFLVGLLQYLSPTISLLVGIFLYHEPFPAERMLGFCIIWSALALLVWDGLARQVRTRRIGAALKTVKKDSAC